MGSASQTAEASLQDKMIALRVEKHFWRHVEKSDNGCWLWVAHHNRNGYGVAYIRKCTVTVHRISWALANGPIPDGMCVCHRCDVRNCVRPDHLFLGTKADNTADMMAKGRGRSYFNWRVAPWPHGMELPYSKLTDVAVVEIRRAYASGEANQRELARRFGVTKENIGYVVRRVTWKHI